MPTKVECPSCGRRFERGRAEVCPECLAGFARVAIEETEPSPGAPVFDEAELAALEQAARSIEGLEILDRIGHGGMGVVFRARQQRLRRAVALKMLPPSLAAQPELASRFEREARALASLNHPHIVTVHEFGIHQGHPFLLMELVDGPSLRAVLAAGRLTPEEALALVPPLCEALQYAHRQGVVHRDIKPENVLLTSEGRVKVADFGLAKLVHSRSGAGLSATNLVMGTPHYMAPEQWERPRAVDHRADIYALGVVLYEMLTGELPLGRFEPPSHHVRLDVRLDAVVLRALERDPERRYQRASEVSRDLTAIGAGRPAEATEVLGSAPEAAPAGNRGRAIFGSLMLILCGLLLGVALWDRFISDNGPQALQPGRPGALEPGGRTAGPVTVALHLLADPAIQQHELRRRQAEGSDYRTPQGFRWVAPADGRAELLVELDSQLWGDSLRFFRMGGESAGTLAFEQMTDRKRQAFDRWSSKNTGRRLALIHRGVVAGVSRLAAGAKNSSSVFSGLDPAVVEELLRVFGAVRVSGIAAERARNLACYRELGRSLAKAHAGKWLVIAHGKLAGFGASIESALHSARKNSAGALHRYVFRLGSEPPLEADWKMHGSLRHGDVGAGLRIEAGFSWKVDLVKNSGWLVTREGKRIEPMLALRAVEGSGAPLRVVPAVNSGFRGAVCLDPATAARLGLARFEIPGIIRGGQISPATRTGTLLAYPARRAWVMLAFEGTGMKPQPVEAIIPEGRPGG